MSEIVSSPLIFSQQEVRDRFQLHQFIHKLFIPCKAGKGDLDGLSAEELYHIFKIQYPMNVLNTAIVSNMLLTGGFVDEENPEMSVLYAKINQTYFMCLKKEAKICLLPFIKAPLDIKYRQLVLGIKVINTIDGTIRPEAKYVIKTFIDMWTLNYNNADNYMHAFKAERRCSTTEVFNYYRILCSIYKLPAVDRSIFMTTMEEFGYEATKGRVHAKAGIRYFPGLYIPMSVEERILSVELNMCCIFNGHTHWTREGILENLIEAQRAELCDKNLERMGFNEQERKTCEEEKAKLDLRRTFETGEIPLGQATQAHETQNDMGYYGGSESESQTSEIKTPQNGLENSISRTSGFKGTKDNAAANETQSRYPIDFDEPLDLGESYRDRYSQFCADDESTYEHEVGLESNDEGSGEDIVESDGPSIEEIASALVVPYTMSIATGFTKEVMLGWLKTMNIPEPEKVLEHYDEIMEILTH